MAVLIVIVVLLLLGKKTHSTVTRVKDEVKDQPHRAVFWLAALAAMFIAAGAHGHG